MRWYTRAVLGVGWTCCAGHRNSDKSAALDANVRVGRVTERDTQRQIVELLRRAGWQVRVISQPTAARAQLVGLPDLIAFKHGVTLLVEVKSEKGKLRPAQFSADYFVPFL